MLSACDAWFLLHFLNFQCCVIFFPGVSEVKLPACTTVSEGHQLRLTVKCDLDAELDNKVKSFINNNVSFFLIC